MHLASSSYFHAQSPGLRAGALAHQVTKSKHGTDTLTCVYIHMYQYRVKLEAFFLLILLLCLCRGVEVQVIIYVTESPLS